jgi:26S proteasome regulatory subunit N1
MLANGIVHSGVKTEADAAFALLEEHVDSNSVPIRTSAIMGIGIAYAGAGRLDILEKLLPIISDTGISMEISSLAALAVGFIFVGTGNGDATGTILQAMMEREAKELDEKWSRFMGLGLALLYLGQQDNSDATIETLKAIEHPISKSVQILVEVCSFAGTGNVLKIQTLLHHCNDHLDPEKDNDLHQAIATIGIALIAMGEDVGADMSLRQFDHLVFSTLLTDRQSLTMFLLLADALWRACHSKICSFGTWLVKRFQPTTTHYGYPLQVFARQRSRRSSECHLRDGSDRKRDQQRPLSTNASPTRKLLLQRA